MPTKKNTNNAPFWTFKGANRTTITKTRGIYLLIMVAIFAICMILPLDFISPMAAPALALVLSVV